MDPLPKRWHIADRLHPDLITHLLKQKGLDDQDQQAFFNPSLEQLAPPSIFPDMDKAVARISQAIDQKQPIVVWGDFDADGVTSTAILWQTLHQLGAKVMPYIPNREDEGHGFSDKGLTQLAEQGTKLIITVDHGIAAFEDVEKLRSLGMEIIITDHHEPRYPYGNTKPPHFPPAIAIIHPLQANIGYLAGCGVSYYLSYAVWLDRHHRGDTLESRQQFADTYAELAAIGTIADLMPLTHTNRILATVGLKHLATTTRPGLKHLYQLANLEVKDQLTMYDVGFVIAPRLNAPGRLANALDSLRLLCINDDAKALKLAKTLDFLNQERQTLLAQVATQAKEIAATQPDGVYVLYHPDWPAGVCGLAAGKIVEAFYRPAVIMEQNGHICRGSARSIKGFDITAALSSIAHLLQSYGGHAMAAGFVAKTDNIPAIQAELTKLLFASLAPDQLQPTLNIDAQLNLADLTMPLYHKLQAFEPCGMGNPKPVFASLGVTITASKTMGADAKHLRLTLDDPATPAQEHVTAQLLADSLPPSRLPISPQPDTPIESLDLSQIRDIFSTTTSSSPPSQSSSHSITSNTAINSNPATAVAFNFGHLHQDLSVGTTIDIAYTLDLNVWNGRSSLQLMVKDIKISDAPSVNPAS